MRHLLEEHCRFWFRGIRSSDYEPGESAGCTDPRHCIEHWRDAVTHVPAKDLPEVECPLCHRIGRVSGYAFDDFLECIVAAPGALCEGCEMSVEDEPKNGSIGDQ